MNEEQVPTPGPQMPEDSAQNNAPVDYGQLANMTDIQMPDAQAAVAANPQSNSKKWIAVMVAVAIVALVGLMQASRIADLFKGDLAGVGAGQVKLTINGTSSVGEQGKVVTIDSCKDDQTEITGRYDFILPDNKPGIAKVSVITSENIGFTHYQEITTADGKGSGTFSWGCKDADAANYAGKSVTFTAIVDAYEEVGLSAIPIERPIVAPELTGDGPEEDTAELAIPNEALDDSQEPNINISNAPILDPAKEDTDKVTTEEPSDDNILIEDKAEEVNLFDTAKLPEAEDKATEEDKPPTETTEPTEPQISNLPQLQLAPEETETETEPKPEPAIEEAAAEITLGGQSIRIANPGPNQQAEPVTELRQFGQLKANITVKFDFAATIQVAGPETCEPTLAASPNAMKEDLDLNDGSVEETITLTLQNCPHKFEDVGKIKASLAATNLPAGLRLGVVELVSPTSFKVTVGGKAEAHEAADSISNLILSISTNALVPTGNVEVIGATISSSPIAIQYVGAEAAPAEGGNGGSGGGGSSGGGGGGGGGGGAAPDEGPGGRRILSPSQEAALEGGGGAPNEGSELSVSISPNSLTSCQQQARISCALIDDLATEGKYYARITNLATGDTQTVVDGGNLTATNNGFACSLVPAVSAEGNGLAAGGYRATVSTVTDNGANEASTFFEITDAACGGGSSNGGGNSSAPAPSDSDPFTPPTDDRLGEILDEIPEPDRTRVPSIEDSRDAIVDAPHVQGETGPGLLVYPMLAMASWGAARRRKKR